MTVWYAIPSKRSVYESKAVLARWRQQGYKLAIWRDTGDEPVRADILLTGKYQGYAKAVNAMCKEILATDPNAQWIVTGGDDVNPDQNHKADEIGAECTAHFGGTFGVMQPTGDRWGEDPSLPNLHPHRTAYVDRVCASPFMGREFCERMYGGSGPLYHEYTHMGVDEELQEVAVNLGVFCQRLDLVHLHEHWARTNGDMPNFLKTANSPQHWNEYKRIFNFRKSAGFPGHEPLILAGTSRGDSEPVLA